MTDGFRKERSGFANAYRAFSMDWFNAVKDALASNTLAEGDMREALYVMESELANCDKARTLPPEGLYRTIKVFRDALKALEGR